MISVECDKRYLKDVIAFARRTGQLASFKYSLQFLNAFACPKTDLRRTRCRLFTDHAPQSFFFVMQRRTWVHRYCLDETTCKTNWVDRMKPDEKEVVCPSCNGQTRIGSVGYEDWFAGGMIYYGQGESGVGDPQFSVRVGDTSQSGWTINT